MNSKIIAFICFCGVWSTSALAKLNVLTTITDLKSIVEEVGGKEVKVESFCRGSQDAHYLEAKPSYMIKTNRADLVIANGLGLEGAWLPKVLAGGRNTNVMQGMKGYFDVGTLVKVLEVPTGAISRADGDVHPEGNPHITLDPIRVGEIAMGIAKKLGELEPKHAAAFMQRATNLKARMEAKTKEWQKRIAATETKKVVTYHKFLSYFLDRFGIETAAVLEPFPGVPPTARHIMEVIKTSQKNGVELILVENYFDDSIAQRVARDLKSVRVSSVPVAVEGRKDIKTIDSLYENLVLTIEGDAKALRAKR